MTRKIWISSALALTTAMLVLAPTTAFAGSPLLSGYGGPGAGEQAILGSTLIGGSRGGGAEWIGGSGGSGGASLSGSAGASTSSVGGTSSTGSGSARGSKCRHANAALARARGAPLPRAGPPRELRGAGDRRASWRRSERLRLPDLSGLSRKRLAPDRHIDGDVLLLVGILATLGLVAVLTLRLSRLQS